MNSVYRNEDAWTEAYRRLQPIARVTLTRSGRSGSDEVDQIVDDVLTALFAKPDLIDRLSNSDRPESIHSYLRAMVRNAAFDLTRSNHRLAHLNSYADLRFIEDPHGEYAETPEFAELLGDWLGRKLPKDELELLELRYAHDQTIGDIADQLNLSYAATAKRLARIRGKIEGVLRSQPSS